MAWEKSTALTSEILAALVKENENRNKQGGPRQNLYDSEAIQCRRKLWYTLNDETPDEGTEKDGEDLFIFKLGDAAQYCVEDILRSMGILVCKELRPEEKTQALSRGRMDDLILFDGFKILEVKSVNTKKFHYVSQEPDEGHLAQLNRYLGKFRVPEGILLYVNRNGRMTPTPVSAFSEYRVAFDPNLWVATEERLKQVLDAKESGVIPARDHKKTEWQCQWCAYFKTCYVRDAKLEGGEKVRINASVVSK